mmetsp:Transcript_24333/g.41640  ORF Transcript_24333/g.41640 Transcript_24333/m.41640 type:complete len:105 (+) Transcript_24333:165-479(+)
MPYQHVAFNVHIVPYRKVHHTIDVMKVVFAEMHGGGCRFVDRAGESVDEGGPFEMMFDDDGVEFRGEGASVASEGTGDKKGGGDGWIVGGGYGGDGGTVDFRSR